MNSDQTVHEIADDFEIAEGEEWWEMEIAIVKNDVTQWQHHNGLFSSMSSN